MTEAHAMRTLDDIEAALQDRLAAEGIEVVGAVPERRARDRAPLSPGQRGVWTYQELAPTSVVYNVGLWLDVTGPVDVEAMTEAFHRLQRRHEVLRTTYHVDDSGSPYQRIHDELSLPIDHVGLDPGLAPDGRPDDLLAELIAEPFDLAATSSLRVTLGRIGSDRLGIILVIHHIAWDAVAFAALSRDLERFYDQAVTGVDGSEIAPLTRQVADFAEWEVDRLEAADHGEVDGYWQAMFADLDALDLPYDRRPSLASESASRLDRELSAPAADNLRTLAEALGATRFEVFMAAYLIVLRRITGQDDAVVGTTVVNREQAGQELLVGNLMNMVSLRYHPAADLTFAHLTDHVRRVNAATFRHKSHPYEMAARAARRVNPDLGMGLFDTVAIFIDAEIDGPSFAGCSTRWELIDTPAALVPLAVEGFGRGERVDVHLTYQEDFFDPETVERIHEYLDQVLVHASATTTVDDLLVLTPGDRERVASWTSGPDMEITPPTLDAMAREIAARYPDRVAVIFEDTELTYAEVDRRVNRCARLLLGAGLQPGDLVAVHADRSEWLPIMVLAAVRAGGVYVPVDPDLPQDRVDFVIDDARPAAVLRGLTPDRSFTEPSVPMFDFAQPATLDLLAAQADGPIGDDELVRPVHPDDPAYLVYTSGTSGWPKGVVVSHRAVANHVQWLTNHFGLIETERALQKTPIGFDVSVAEIMAALSSGAAVVMGQPGWWWMDAHALADCIEQYEITVLSFVPTLLRAFLDAGISDERLRSVRIVVCGGESVSPWLAEEAGKAFDCPVIGLYGPSEATMDITYEDFSDVRHPSEYRSALIGVPEANSSVWVLDEKLRPCPQGVTGELYVGGVQLALGYHQRPGLTAAAFVACPFPERQGERMYRTGDLARWNRRGRLEFLGRADEQVKIRGHRVELGEVGTVLRQVPGVTSAAVAALEHADNKVLVGYYIPDPADERSDDEQADLISTYLGERLPGYMVPPFLIRVGMLPTNANGKLDIKALPQPDFDGRTGEGRPLAGEREHLVAQVLSTILDLPEDTTLAADDDFLRLGGDSISAIRMAAALRKHGLELSTRELFEARTIAAMAKAASTAAPSVVPVLTEVDGPYGEVPLAREVVADLTSGPLRPAPALSLSLVTPPEVTPAALQQALDRAVRRHPALCARLDDDGGGRPTLRADGDNAATAMVFTTRVIEPRPGPVGNGGSEAGAADSIEDERRTESERLAALLDPTDGPLVAASLLQRADGGDGRLVLVAGGLVVDPPSLALLAADVAEAWRTGADLPPSTATSYRAWQVSRAEREGDEPAPPPSGPDTSTGPAVGRRAPDPTVDTQATRREVRVCLDGPHAAHLASTALDALRADAATVQLSALLLALSRQGSVAPSASIDIELVRHIRDGSPFADADVAATVGRFTSIDTLEVAASALVQGNSTAVPDAVAAARAVKTAELASFPATPGRIAAVRFNDLGRLERAGTDEGARWRPAPDGAFSSPIVDPAGPIPAVIEVESATFVDGDDVTIEATFRFADGLIDADTASAVAGRWVQAMTELGSVVSEDPGPYLTTDDVLAGGVDQIDLDGWRVRHGRVVDVHPLAPMQEAIYLAGLASAGGDVYNAQVLIGVRGELDAARLDRSMQLVANRYPNLRASIGFSRTGVPCAVIPAAVEFPLTELDLSGAEGELTDQLAELIEADLATPFDYGNGPLLRGHVIHLPGDEHLLVLTAHHVISDGWSGNLMPGEVFAHYAAGEATAPLVESDTFAHFLADIDARRPSAHTAWERYLDRIDGATLVAPEHESGVDNLQVDHEFVLDVDLVRRLHDVAADAGTTLSSVVQLAWANVLRTIVGEDAVVFGEVVAGRPTSIEGIEYAVGAFANTVPRVVELGPDRSWRSHLDVMQEDRVALMDFDQYPLIAAHRSAQVRRLFDTLVVFQSAPSGESAFAELLATMDLELLAFDARSPSEHALVLYVYPQDGFRALLSFAPASFDEAAIAVIEKAFVESLRAIGTDPEGLLGDSSPLTAAEQGRLAVRRLWHG
ncbi:MAG: amino acid adenylation domain-containing protein [Actinomycetota bacterium]